MRKKAKKKKNAFLLSIKRKVFMLCLICFFFNSYIIFKQFIENETVTTFKMQETSKLHLPSITFCGTSGFKRSVNDFSDFELEKYFNNTIQLSEIVEKVADHKKMLYVIDHDSNTIFDASGNWNIVETYSAYRGRCYTFEYKEMVICLNEICDFLICNEILIRCLG